MLCCRAEQHSCCGGTGALIQCLRKMWLDLIITWKLWLCHSGSLQWWGGISEETFPRVSWGPLKHGGHHKPHFLFQDHWSSSWLQQQNGLVLRQEQRQGFILEFRWKVSFCYSCHLVIWDRVLVLIVLHKKWKITDGGSPNIAQALHLMFLWIAWYHHLWEYLCKLDDYSNKRGRCPAGWLLENSKEKTKFKRTTYLKGNSVVQLLVDL